MLTSADVVIMLTVGTIFDVPQQLQGFSTDDVYGTEALRSAELAMGVDGNLSAGFIFVAVVQDFVLQGDSESNDIFDAWYAAQQSGRTLFPASATIKIPATGKKYSCTRGFLTGYIPLPDAKKILQARKYQITWQKIDPALI